MPYFTDLNTYLHRSSQLVQAYPSARITTKYSLPKKATKERKDAATTSTPADSTGAATGPAPSTQPKRDPSAILTLKTYHPDSGICLKYKTDKAAEVGRLLTGLGRLAKGEIIELPVTAAAATATAGVPTGVDDADKMDVDSRRVVASGPEAKAVVAPPAATQTAGGGGKGKKKKGKK